MAYGARLKELLPESVVLERTPRHDSQADPAERAIRTLEEQIKVLRLDFEKRNGTELLAKSCLWPWLIRHAGWLDARFRVKRNGATPCQDAYDSTYSSELLPFGELELFRIPLPHTRRTNQNGTIYRGDSGWDKGFWCGRLDEDNPHIIVTENGREIARTAPRLPLSQSVDVSLLKRVKGLPWDGQGLVRRGGPPRLVLPEPSDGRDWRNTSNWRIIFGWNTILSDLTWTDVNVDTETEWTPPRSKTPDPTLVEETKRLRSTAPTRDTGDNTKMELADEETRKRALVEPTEDDDDEPAEKYWRAEDFVAKASMDELTGTWITDENGILDEDAAGDTWSDCLEAGELDRQAADEATENALDSLLAHGVVEDVTRGDAKGFKTLTTRWDKRWRMKDGEWKMKVRFVGREYKWAEHREDLFSPGATQSASHVIDFLALKMGLETFEADAVDACYQAPDHEEVVVEPAPEYLERLAKAGRDTDIVWRLRRQLPGRRAAGQSWVEHVAGVPVNKNKLCAVHHSTTVPLVFRENGCAGIAHG